MSAGWNAPFITPTADFVAPALFRDFTLESAVSARLDITGLGLYRAFINGQRAGGDYLTPGFNDYDAYLRYQSYDVTALIKAENRIEVLLGDGWYKGRFGLSGRSNIFGSRYLLSARLVITHADGHESTLLSDDSWRARASCITENSIYDGEVRDDTLSGAGEDAACRIVETPYRPEPQFSPPIRVKAELQPVLLHSPAGETILDFQQNMAGVVRFINRLPRGARMRLQFGELLQDGCFCRDNLRTAKAAYVYISDGITKPVEPYFTYYGFRYINVEGLAQVDPADFTALALSSDLSETLTVETDSPAINRLMQNALWGQRSNFLDVPTDCPQRDERLGWTADTQVFTDTACYQMDCKDFYRKFLRDLRVDQQRYLNGNIPMYSPSLKGECGPGGAVWADAATIVPWKLYRHYGDVALLKENYPMMRDYVHTLLTEDEAHGGRHIIDYGFCFGDWLALDGASALSMKGGTEDAFIQSVYYYHSVHLTAQAAAVLQYADDAVRYAELAAAIRQAILDEYVTPSGRLAVHTQTAYVLALSYGIWRDRKRMVEGFVARLKTDSYRLTTGFAGTPLLLPVLFDNGLSDIAYRMLYREEFPGWLYAVKLGATTLWERWNSVLEDGRLSGAGMNSLNHYAYGAVCGAIYSRIAGLRCDTPGWKSAVIAPQPNGRMKRIDLSFSSPAGRYRVRWELLEEGTLSLLAEIPAGAHARLVLPAHPENAMHELSAGAHSFCYRPTVDYLHPFSSDSPACALIEHPEADAILRAEAPALHAFLTGDGCDLAAQSPRALIEMLPFAAETDIPRLHERLRLVSL